MNGEILLLFVILLLALILSTYLGGENGIYPIVEGMEPNSKAFTYTNSTKYVSENGSNAEIRAGTKGNNLLTITTYEGKKINYATSSGADLNTFYASDGKGGRAIITTGFGGKPILTVTDPNGNKIIFYLKQNRINPYFTNSYDNYNHYTGTSHAFIHYGPNGGTAKIIDNGDGNTIVITNNDGTSDIYYVDKKTFPSATTYVGPNGSIAKILKNASGKSAVEISDYNGTKIVYTEDNIYNNTSNIQKTLLDSGYEKYTKLNDKSINNMLGIYNNSLPAGISRSQIPSGQEDLYILKSEVVPPVCPKCPAPIVKCDCANGGGEFDVSKCPPCPGPMRCPEPSFDCKKVPNYNAFKQNYMPVPVLNDFSTFGM